MELIGADIARYRLVNGAELYMQWRAETVTRFNQAVRECLDRCYRADDRLAQLALYIGHLRADGWLEADIDEVETTVRRMLCDIVSVDRSDSQ